MLNAIGTWGKYYANKRPSALQELQAARDVEHERRIVSMKAEYADMEASHQDKLARARQVAQAEVEHMRVRTDAEFTDLRATISRLEVDLAKVRLASFCISFAQICVCDMIE